MSGPSMSRQGSLDRRGASFDSSTRGKKKIAPTSLVSHAKSKGYCSVTDLVSPVWCEYAYQYNTLGMSHLPIEERPREIATPQGNKVRPNVEIAHEREKVLKSGREVHKRLEKEIHPVKVRVHTTTKEDIWGLRLLQLITGLKVLLEDGCCRELPVFGFIEGVLVFGVIDEIKLHHDRDPASTTKKLYSSQEEWKKKASQQKKTKVDPSQKSLAAFIPGIKSVTVIEEDLKEVGLTGMYGFVLEDAKTRWSMSMPDEKDQIQSKLQCMLYKRLLDGLIAGVANDLKGARLDGNATPMSIDHLLSSQGLKGDVGLSEAFMRDAQELCESFQLTLKVDQDDEGKWTCNLNYLFGILATTLDDLIDMAQKGSPEKDDFPIIREELRLTYRKRGGEWKRKSSAVRTAARVGLRRGAKDSSIDLLKLLQRGVRIEDLDEESQVEFALQASLGDTQKEEEKDDILADQSIAMPPSPKKTVPKDFIIGTSKFTFDSRILQEHINDIMGMWKGTRPLRGVTIEQTWRCNHCEYQTDCEWRAAKAEESLQRVWKKRQVEEEDEAMWSQVDDLPEDIDGMEW